MTKNLVIVESPAKARTIEKFLGKDYVVKSSFGHVRDLPKKGLNIDIDKNFQPHYEISLDKQKIVTDLKKSAKGATVWLASDEDREGEAIAWHLTQALKLDPKDAKRIVFHEITKPAILNAIKNPRNVDIKLVEAQQARRVLDRLVGYELSPVLWKKVRGGLSAGRVQSVAVRIIVDREREIKAFERQGLFKVKGIFNGNSDPINAELSIKLSDSTQTKKWLTEVSNSEYSIDSVDKKPGFRNPSAPFTTSTLQQEASRKLGLGVRQTMSLAQRLYEAGHITYMRTDSTIMSEIALSAAGKLINQEYGTKYHKLKQYQTKQQSAQEAHEAIRPTNINRNSAGINNQEKKLYSLIRQRTIASQMSPAQLEKTEIVIKISNKKEVFIAKGETLLFDGFLKVYGKTKDDILLPSVTINQKLKVFSIVATETYSKPPARFSEASLVRKLEDLGIGRPSTYASTISTIQTRGYIEKSDIEGITQDVQEISLIKGKIDQNTVQIITGADKSKLLPTPIADIVTDFLVKYFPTIVDLDFTAKVEADFDNIAAGKVTWDKMIKDFYHDFHPLVSQSEDVPRSEVSKSRKLGVDPKSKEPIFARFGRYGPMLVKGDIEDETKKPLFAPMPSQASVENVTLNQALEMFKLPRVVGQTVDGIDIKANIGRFGPYIQIDKKYVSIKPHDPLTITLDEALELYKSNLDKNKAIKEFSKSGIKILNGPYGIYLTNGTKNARLAKDLDPSEIDEKQAIELLEKAKTKSSRFKNKSSK